MAFSARAGSRCGKLQLLLGSLCELSDSSWRREPSWPHFDIEMGRRLLDMAHATGPCMLVTRGVCCVNLIHR